MIVRSFLLALAILIYSNIIQETSDYGLNGGAGWMREVLIKKKKKLKGWGKDIRSVPSKICIATEAKLYEK